MSKLEAAKEILNTLQVPTKQQNGMCCCVLLAMANILENSSWRHATNEWLRIHDVIAFSNRINDMTWQEKRFLTAVTLIGKGRSVYERFEQFLLCTSGIETLIKMGKKRLTTQFKMHSATLLSADSMEQQNIATEMGRLYDIRSDIAHGKNLFVSFNDLARIHLRSFEILKAFFFATQTMQREEQYSEYLCKMCSLNEDETNSDSNYRESEHLK